MPSLADQIKRFQPRVFSIAENPSGVFYRSAKVGHVALGAYGVGMPGVLVVVVSNLVCVSLVAARWSSTIPANGVHDEIQKSWSMLRVDDGLACECVQ